MGKTKLLLVCLCFMAHQAWYPSNARVVVFFPSLGISHIRYHTNVARVMSDQGHEAWVCMPDDGMIRNDKIDVSGIKVLRYGQVLDDYEKHFSGKVLGKFWNNETLSVFDMIPIAAHFDELIVSIINGGFIDEIKALKPDLFVIDGVPFLTAIYVVPYKLGIPYAVLGTVHDAIRYRIPFSPAATPLQIATMSDSMNFWQRCESAKSYFAHLIGPVLFGRDIIKEIAPEKTDKTLSELLTGAEIFIVEIDPIMDYPRPMLPNTKLVGGTAVKNAKPLKDPFKVFVDNSEMGVIVVTFGSTFSNVPEYIFNKIHTACKRSGLNIVWRSDQPSPDPKQILTSEWVPQNDVLGHNNTKLFISHCGKNGQYEALYHGVPILCLPIFGDQPYNSERVRAKGFGLKADMRSISTDDLSDMIREIITNTTYKTNIAKASKLFRLLYKSPMKEAAFWLDHVMEYGGDYMRAASQKMPYYQFLMLDVIAVLLFVIHVVGLVLFVVIRSFICWCFRTKTSILKSA